MSNSPDQTQNSSPESEFEFDFGRYYHLFLRHLWIVIVVTGVIVVGTAAWVFRQPKIYASTALLQVEQEEQKVVHMEDVQSEKLDADDYLKTIQGAMTNHSLLLSVVKLANLEKDPHFATPRPDRAYSDVELAEIMSKKVDVSLRRGSRLIEVTVEDQDPVKACDLAKMLVKEFLRENYQQTFEVSEVANDFLVGQADKLQAKLEQSENKLQQYKEQNKAAVSLAGYQNGDQSGDQNITIEKLKDINTKVTEAKSERLRLESDIEQLKRLEPDDLDGILQIGSVSSIPQIASIRVSIVSAEADLATVKKRYMEKHPKYIQAQSQLDQLQQSLRGSLKNVGDILRQQYQGALDSENKLTQSLEEQKNEALELSKIAIPYDILVREVDSYRAAYDAVVSRVRETKITQGIEKSPFREIQVPMVSNISVRPKKMLILAAALAAGLAVSCGIILAMDFTNTTLHSVDQAEHLLGLPCLTVVAQWDHKRGKNQAEAGEQKRPMIMITEPQSPAAESYRTLRAGLSLLGDPAHRRSFILTSAIPSEGKSFTAINLALAFALEGLKTIIIDADLRLPTIQKTLLGQSDPMPGLTDLLSKNSTLNQVIHASKFDNLSFVPAGNRAPNPAELLGGSGFAEFLEELSVSFDRIIIDSAPINAVSDTLRIAALADYICLIVRAGKTPRKAVFRAKRLILNAGGKMAGFVLNRTTFGRTGGYYYYYYGGKYAEDGVYGTSAEKSSQN